jgi:biopolymer transport protein ExbD
MENENPKDSVGVGGRILEEFGFLYRLRVLDGRTLAATESEARDHRESHFDSHQRTSRPDGRTIISRNPRGRFGVQRTDSALEDASGAGSDSKLGRCFLAAGLNDQINVTPLADVMLVLLIIFMVVTPMIKPGVEVRVPEAENPRERPGDETTLVLSMREDGSLFLNRDDIAAEEISQKLFSLMERRTEKTLFLKASAVLDYGGCWR